MRTSMTVGIVLTLVLGFGLYSWQMQQLAKSSGAAAPSGIVDAVAVKADLLGMAGAERQQYALEGRYASFEELQRKGAKLPEKRGAYTYSIEATATTFLVKATYVPTEGADPQPNLSIGPDMKIVKEGQDQADD